MPTNRVTGILNGTRAITADTALRLSAYSGTSAEMWMDLQKDYELRTAELAHGGGHSERRQTAEGRVTKGREALSTRGRGVRAPLIQIRRNVMPNTVRLHRVLATAPEKVYRAFLEADALAKWLPPDGFACTVHHLEPKVGGTFKMSFRNFTTGNGHSFGGTYRELVPNERLRYTDTFDDPNLPGDIQVTVTLRKVSVGTEVDIVQEGLPDVIPVEACYLGWQQSLKNLARLVEPEIRE